MSFFGNKGALLVVLLVVCLRCASSAGASIELGRVAEFVLRSTPAGSSLVSRFTSSLYDEVTDAGFRSFVSRLEWAQAKPFRTQLQAELTRIEESFEAYRTERNRSPKLADGETLLPDEREFLSRASEGLRGNVVDGALKESITFLDAFVGHRSSSEGVAESLGDTGGEVPARVEPAAFAFAEGGDVDLRRLELNWWRKMFLRFHAYSGFAKSFILSDGQWRSLFSRSGKRFTVMDEVKISKWSHLLGVIGPYGEMRLVVRAFANEPAPIVNRLFELTTDAAAKYAQGFETVDTYINSVRSLASAQGLPLNDITWAAQRGMLNVIERCRALGGKLSGATLRGSEIELAEERVARSLAKVKEVEARIAEDRAEGRSKARLTHEAVLENQRVYLDRYVKDLRQKYLDFVQVRRQIEIFANLRHGRIGSEVVAPFDMPDIFVVSQEQLDAWRPVYDRALYNTTNELMLGHLSLAAKTEVGATRSVIRGLNKMTRQVVGRQFTDTDSGRDFERYARNRMTAAIIRLGKMMGIAIPLAVAEQTAKTQVEKVIREMSQEDHSAPGGAAKGGSGSPAQGSGVGNPGNGVSRSLPMPGILIPEWTPIVIPAAPLRRPPPSADPNPPVAPVPIDYVSGGNR